MKPFKLLELRNAAGNVVAAAFQLIVPDKEAVEALRLEKALFAEIKSFLHEKSTLPYIGRLFVAPTTDKFSETIEVVINGNTYQVFKNEWTEYAQAPAMQALALMVSKAYPTLTFTYTSEPLA